MFCFVYPPVHIVLFCYVSFPLRLNVIKKNYSRQHDFNVNPCSQKADNPHTKFIFFSSFYTLR